MKPISYIPAKSRLTFIKDLGMREATSGKKASRKRYALYICECGALAEVMVCHAKAGNTISCGCLQYESLEERNFKHGMSKHPLYNNWKSIINRCYSERHKSYHRYGGRGIGVCEEWRTDPTDFIAWAEEQGCQPGDHIHRRDHDKGYSPDNCISLNPSDHMRLHGYDNVKNFNRHLKDAA